MKCPYCDQVPISPLGYFVAAKTGVGFQAGLHGFVKCKHCMSTLRVTPRVPLFPYWIAPIMIFVLYYTLPLVISEPFSDPGKIIMALLLVLLSAVVIGIITYVMWKSLKYQKAVD